VEKELKSDDFEVIPIVIEEEDEGVKINDTGWMWATLGLCCQDLKDGS